MDNIGTGILDMERYGVKRSGLRGTDADSWIALY